MPVLESLGTAVPGPAVPQSEVKALAESVIAPLAPELVEKLSVFDSTGIRTRHFASPLDWYLEPHGWADRSAVYQKVGLATLEEAAREALVQARLTPRDIDGIILVSTTGISTPSLDARLVDRLGLRPDVLRVPVFGMGCAGGVSGLALAGDLARAHPDKRFLLLTLELCSLAFNPGDLSVRAFVATTLFSDGAAAAIVRGDDVQAAPDAPRLASVRPGALHQWPESQDVMGWDVLDEGLRVVFSRRIPTIVANELRPVVEAYLKREGRVPDRHVYHPGGTKVLQAYQDALGVTAEALSESAWALRQYGNMSSPTVLFALQESLRRRALAPGEAALLAALGPGFTAALCMLEG